MSTTSAATDSAAAAATVSATGASTMANITDASSNVAATNVWVFNNPFLNTGGTTSSGTVGSTFSGTVGSVLGSNVGAFGLGTVGSALSGTMGSMFGSSVGSYGFNTCGSFFGTTSGPRMMPTAEKPPKFGGADFKRWQQKMLFYLTTLGFASFLKEDKPPAPSAQETNFTVRAAYDNWHNGDYLCKNFILNSLEDSLYNVYSVVSTSKEMWAALEKKYRSDDAGTKKFVVAKYLDYKMVDSKPIMDQVQEFQLIIHDVNAEGMVLSDAFTVAIVIEKLPPSWKDFKSYLKHKRKEMTLEDLIVKLRIEADVPKNDYKPKGLIDAKANLLEHGGPSNKQARPSAQNKYKGKQPIKKFDGDCFNCGKPGHTSNCSNRMIED